MSITRPVQAGLVAAAVSSCLALLALGAVSWPAGALAHAGEKTELLGYSQIAGSTDADQSGMAEAFATTASDAGTLRSLHLFVDSSSEATAVELGVYADADGDPGELLASGRIAQPAAGKWNSVNIAPTDIEAGKTYWIAMLGTGGRLAFRDHCCGGGSPAKTTPEPVVLDGLPPTWTSGQTWNDGPASFHGSTEPAGGDEASPAGVAITADLDKGLQTIDGLGVNANVHSWHDGELAPAIDKLAAAGVTTWRVIIDRCDWESTNDDGDPEHFDADYYAQVYERGKMADLWKTLAYVESKPGARVVLNCMGGVPLWMGGTDKISRIDEAQEDEWVEMIASLVHYGRTVKGLKFKLLAPSNEVDWDGNEGPQIPSEQYVRLLRKLAGRLDKLGLDDIRFVGPDAADAGKAAADYYPAMAADPVVMAKTARIGVHAYDGNGRGIGDAIADSEYPDTPWWVTEFSAWCSGCDSGAPNPADWDFAGTIADHLLRLIDQGASGAQLYDAWDGYYEHHASVGYWGALAYDAVSGTYSPRKSYHVLQQFTKFVPSGARRTESSSSDGALKVESFRDPATERVTLVLRNTSGSPLAATGALQGPHAVATLATYVTDADANFARGEDLAVDGGKFTVTVPADSLMTLTGGAADEVAPTVSLESPEDGATVSGVVAVRAAAGDDVGVARVEFSVDGQPVGSDESAPYGFDWDTRELADGPHTVTAVAFDAAGQASEPASATVQVSNTSTTIDTGPPAHTQDPTPTFTFSSSDPVATFECRLDGPDAKTGTWSACAAPYTLDTLTDGAYTLLVRAVDRAGNADPTPATRSFVVDTRVPSAPEVSSPRDGSAQRISTIHFAGRAEPLATVEVEEDGVTRGSAEVGENGTWSLEISAVGDGVHRYAVSTRDAAGHVSGPTTVTVTVDTLEPDTTIDSGPPAHTRDVSPSFEFSSPEPGVRFECRLDGPGDAVGDYASCSSPKSYTSLADGDYTLRVRAVDAAGNVEQEPAMWRFTVDTAFADTMITSGPNAPTKDSSPSFEFASPEGGVHFECRLDGPGSAIGEFAVCASPKAFASLADGDYAFHVRAVDLAGNPDPTPATRSFTIDTKAPDAPTIARPLDDSVQSSTTVAMSGTAEPAATVVVDEGGADRGSVQASGSGAWELEIASVGDGPHTFTARARDAAGNLSAPSQVRVRIDATEPETTVSGPSGLTRDRSPSFELSSSKDGSTFACRLDGPGAVTGEWAACSSPKAFTNLADGAYTLHVRATDAAGNTDSTPATRSFTVDATAAETEITSGPEGVTPDRSPSFGFTSPEAAVGFECRLDGPGSATGEFEACTSPKAFSNLADGAYTLRVRSVDAAGNRDATPATRSFVVDATAADTGIAGGPSGPTNDPSPTFGFTSPEAGATFECRLDGPGAATAEFAACGSPKTFTNLADGDYTLRARSVDAAGNKDASPATRDFTVDTVAPETTIDSGPTTASSDDSLAFGFSVDEPGARLECRLEGPGRAGAAFASCASPQRYGALAPGDYTFAVRGSDAAGNVGAPASRRFTIRTEPMEPPAEPRRDAPAPAATPTPAPMAIAATPTFRRSLVARPVQGKVLVREPGVKAAVALTTAREVAVGSLIDTKAGEVELTAAAKAGGPTYTGAFRGGIFTVTQRRAAIELRLKEALAPCRSARSARSSKPKVRRLWGAGRGQFLIRGAYSTAGSRDGKWVVEDTCSRTTTRVSKGVAEVVERGKSRRVKVRAGRKHVARAAR